MCMLLLCSNPLAYEIVFRTLLITLAIFKALATECRREMALLSPSLLASVNATLSSLSMDLEIAARAATVVCARHCAKSIYAHTLLSLRHGRRTPTALSLALT